MEDASGFDAQNFALKAISTSMVYNEYPTPLEDITALG